LNRGSYPEANGADVNGEKFIVHIQRLLEREVDRVGDPQLDVVEIDALDRPSGLRTRGLKVLGMQ
jgi:hypothetical protein